MGIKTYFLEKRYKHSLFQPVLVVLTEKFILGTITGKPDDSEIRIFALVGHYNIYQTK